MTLKGIIASTGITMGEAYVFEKTELIIDNTVIEEHGVDAEKERIDKAVNEIISSYDNKEDISEEQRQVYNAHKELLSDPYLLETIGMKIGSEFKNAELALDETIKDMVDMMASLDDPYLKERALDYKDIGSQLMYRLKGIQAEDLAHLETPYIIISEELTPSDTSSMAKDFVLGFATVLGGKTSHTSIIAQTLGIPALVGMPDLLNNVNNGDFLILDAQNGKIIINPDNTIIEDYKVKMDSQRKEKERLELIKNKAAKTTDGRLVEVATNIGNLEDLKLGIESGCDGVGLFRTEFLYMENTHFPTEEEQFIVYKEAAQMLEGKPLIIRTLDIGGDKSLPYYEFPVEENPFLGWRALRICFDKPEIFNAQLSAILRASYYGKVRILLPMIISVDEIVKVKEILEEVKISLRERQLPFDENIEIGIMIETPASVIVAEDLIEYVDYFSVGTNDLTQYVLAVDRGNDKISHLYNTYNPAVLRSIKMVIDASHKAGKWTGMCGGFAGDIDATYLLLGMGLDEFSAPATKIPAIKDIVLNADYEEAKAFADEVLSLQTTAQIQEKIANR